MTERLLTSETVQAKAGRYLAEGRVKVLNVSAGNVEAHVQGSAGEPYSIRRAGKRWTCSCPAWQRRCAHVVAVELVA